MLPLGASRSHAPRAGWSATETSRRREPARDADARQTRGAARRRRGRGPRRRRVRGRRAERPGGARARRARAPRAAEPSRCRPARGAHRTIGCRAGRASRPSNQHARPAGARRGWPCGAPGAGGVGVGSVGRSARPDGASSAVDRSGGVRLRAGDDLQAERAAGAARTARRWRRWRARGMARARARCSRGWRGGEHLARGGSGGAARSFSTELSSADGLPAPRTHLSREDPFWSDPRARCPTEPDQVVERPSGRGSRRSEVIAPRTSCPPRPPAGRPASPAPVAPRASRRGSVQISDQKGRNPSIRIVIARYGSTARPHPRSHKRCFEICVL